MQTTSPSTSGLPTTVRPALAIASVTSSSSWWLPWVQRWQIHQAFYRHVMGNSMGIFIKHFDWGFGWLLIGILTSILIGILAGFWLANLHFLGFDPTQYKQTSIEQIKLLEPTDEESARTHKVCWARGGGLVVTVFTFYSDNPSSNPTKVNRCLCKMLFQKKENKLKEAAVGPLTFLKAWSVLYSSAFKICRLRTRLDSCFSLFTLKRWLQPSNRSDSRNRQNIKILHFPCHLKTVLYFFICC